MEREELRIPYRETITMPAHAEGKHKKQSGGHGQFGICHLPTRTPARAGRAPSSSMTRSSGGAIRRQYIPAVEKGVIETMSNGGVFGYPVVDIAVTVDDGKAHSGDSNEVSFKMAAAAAIRQAMQEAGPILLEPISRLEVTIPSDSQGDVLGDLHSRRAHASSVPSQGDDGFQIVDRPRPHRRADPLRGWTYGLTTGGRESFTVVYDHYDPVPEHLVASIAQAPV